MVPVAPVPAEPPVPPVQLSAGAPEPPAGDPPGGSGATGLVGVLGEVDGLGEADVPVDADVAGAGVVVVDSVGRVVLVRGVGERVGAGVVAGRFGVADGCGLVRAFLAIAGRRRGNASTTARAVGEVVTGAGAGVGRASGECAPDPSSLGSGRIALELTGPPARLRQIRPP